MSVLGVQCSGEGFAAQSISYPYNYSYPPTGNSAHVQFLVFSSNKAYFEIIQFSTFKLSSKTAIIVIQYVTMLQQNTDFQI